MIAQRRPRCWRRPSSSKAEVGGRRHEPDGPEARRRQGGRQGRRGNQELGQEGHHQRRDRQVGTISGQRRPRSRRDDRQARCVGNEGVITVEEAKTAETELDVVEGMQFGSWLPSPYFITNAEKMDELEEPMILLRKEAVLAAALLPVLEAVVQSGRPLLIIEGEGVARHPGGHRCAAACGRPSRPGAWRRRKAMLEDTVILIGGQLISKTPASRERHPRHARQGQEGHYHQGRHPPSTVQVTSRHRRPDHPDQDADRG